MKKPRKDKHFIKKPVYPGGRKAFLEFVNRNLKYPARAIRNRVEGTVNLKYTIDHRGNVIDVHVLSGLGHGCDEEAKRLVRMLKFKVPRSARGIKVQYHKDIHIHFRLPGSQDGTALQYSLIKSENTSSETGTGYHYTIDIN